MTTDARPARRAGAIGAVALGNAVEMFDFMVFGYFARPVARAFFPSADAYASLMMAFMTFGAGFLMRPLGAVVLGGLADRRGRRVGLMTTLGLMAVGSLTLAVTPDYARIGLAAPLLVLAGRLVQGFSAGAELGAVSVYLTEIAPPGREGLYASFQSASQQVAVVAAAGFGVALAGSGPIPGVGEAFRIPFATGALIAPAIALLRRAMPESLPRAAAQAPARPSRAVSAARIASGAAAVATTTVTFYVITAYMPTYGSETLKLPQIQAFAVTACVGASNLLWLPVFGALSDRVGRTPLLAGSLALLGAGTYPALRWIAAGPSFGRLLAAGLGLSVLFAGYNAALIPTLAARSGADARARRFSLAYSLATALLGGFTPAVSAVLVRATHDAAAPGLWIAAATVLSAVGLWAGAKINDADGSAPRSPSRVRAWFSAHGERG